MTMIIKCTFACLALASVAAHAENGNGCPAGSYTIVVAPDGATLSILFDKFTVDSGSGGSAAKTCRIAAPLNLPPDRSIGVYKVDYRGFAKLGAKQAAELDVRYILGPQAAEHGRNFKRKVKGPQEGDYLFSETLGAGQMKRVGCGAAAVLNVDIALKLIADANAAPAMASLDSSDAAPGAALVYHLDLKKCP